MSISVTDLGADEVTATEQPREWAGNNVWRDIWSMLRHLWRHIKNDPLWATLLWAFAFGSSTIGAWLGLRWSVASSEVTNGLVAMDREAFMPALIESIGYLIAMVVLGALGIFFDRVLRFRLRTNLFERLYRGWLRRGKLYALNQRHQIDYPEQRVQQDTYDFSEQAVALLPMILGNLSSFYLFSNELWIRSESYAVSLPGGFGFVIPKALYLSAIVTPLLILGLVHLVGRVVTRLEVVRLRLEAGFRHDMGMAREHAEQIALTNGEPTERRRTAHHYDLIRRNWWPLSLATAILNGIQGTSTYIAMLVPTILLFPVVLSGEMQVGDLQLTSMAFGSVSSTLATFSAAYGLFAVIRASTLRIDRMEAAVDAEDVSEIRRIDTERQIYELDNLTVVTPAGKHLVTIDRLQIAPGDRLLIKGRSGVGKSTLFRAMSGIWPFGSGEITRPSDDRDYMFLPQIPFLPNGSLAEVLSYPHDPEEFPEHRFAEVLHDVQLGELVDQLHEEHRWSKILSPGEQQRVCFGRALLQRPKFLFMDEASSSLDAQTEREITDRLLERLGDTAIVSISHSERPSPLHERILSVENGRGRLIDDLKDTPS